MAFEIGGEHINTNVVIIADDLTGANDTGVQFCKAGLSTTVLLEGDKLLNNQIGLKVTVINTDTRALSKESAYEHVSQLAKKLSNEQNCLVYKKIDSMMRGNIGTEIDALMDHINFDFCVVVPAYPRNSRITVGGYHMVKNVLLEDSDASKDPKCPMNESFLPNLVSEQSKRQVGHIDIKKIRSNAIQQEVEQLLSNHKEIMTFDSVVDSDLKAITYQLFNSKYKILWVGSAGLAFSLSELISDNKNDLNIVSNDSDNGKVKLLPALAVAGSLSSVTREQIAFLKEQGVELISLDPIKLFKRDVNEFIQSVEYKTVKELLDAGKNVCISTEVSLEKKKEVEQYLIDSHISVFDSGNLIAEGIGLFASSLIKQVKINGIVLTGGDIAYQTLKQLNIHELEIVSEIEEGIPLCRVIGGVFAHLPVITKSGAFGNKFSLYYAMGSLNTNIRGITHEKIN